VFTPDGAASIAWAGLPRKGENRFAATGVFVAQRAAGATEFDEPQRVTGELTNPAIQLAVGARGDRALAWFRRGTQADGGPLPMLVSVAPPGGAFGLPQEVPVPPRVPPKVDPPSPDNRGYGYPSVAVSGDGTVLLAYRETDDDADLRRIDVAVRHPDGSWAEPQVLGEANAEPAAAADGAGGLHVIWIERWTNPEGDTFVYANDAGPDGSFGPAQRISTPGRAAYDGNSQPALHANARGDLLALWNSASLPTTGAPDWIEVAERPAGSTWGPPRTIGRGIRPTGALNNAGDATVAWTTWTQVPGRPNFSIVTSFRPDGGPWGVETGGWKPTAAVDPVPIALGDTGTAVMAVTTNENAGVAGLERVREHQFGEPVGLTETRHGGYGTPEVALDRFGNGLVTFGQFAAGDTRTIYTVAYGVAPPVVTSFRAAANEFKFRVNEPARVRLTLRHGRRTMRQRARARPGRNRISFTPAIRAFLRHPGRYYATIRARDAGPGESRPRVVAIER
jgi:hypothetical protein